MDDRKPSFVGIDREQNDKLHAELDRALSDKFLAQQDMGALLMREFEDGISLTLPLTSEIDKAMQPESQLAPSAGEMHALLSLDDLGDISVQGIKLNELLSGNAITGEERALLKTGFLFLNLKRYTDAADWWILKRPSDPVPNQRIYCLLTLLLAFTYQLSGDTERAQEAVRETRRVREAL